MATTDSSKPAGLVRRVAEETAKLHPWGAAKAIVAGWGEHDVLTYASAIAFQVFFALIPLLLFALGLLGALNLEDLWTEDVAEQVKGQVSGPVFQVLDDTVRQILEERHVFWVTAGAAVMVWKVSCAVRAVMGVYNRIYGCADSRSAVRRYATSIALAVAASLLVLFAVGVIRFGAPLLDPLGVPEILSFLGRWSLGIAALLLVVAILGRHAPAKERPWTWVSFGAVVSVGGWIVMSLLFGWYLTHVAHYGSLFGNLATIFVVLEYLYISVVVGLTGVLVDSLARDRVESGS